MQRPISQTAGSLPTKQPANQPSVSGSRRSLQSRAEPKKQEKLQRQSRYIAGLLGALCPLLVPCSGRCSRCTRLPAQRLLACWGCRGRAAHNPVHITSTEPTYHLLHVCLLTSLCPPAALLCTAAGAEKAEERKREQDILYERQLAKERAAGVYWYGQILVWFLWW